MLGFQIRLHILANRLDHFAGSEHAIQRFSLIDKRMQHFILAAVAVEIIGSLGSWTAIGLAVANISEGFLSR
ncbi:hypothetical protein D3C77_541880 [compost metagenome]